MESKLSLMEKFKNTLNHYYGQNIFSQSSLYQNFFKQHFLWPKVYERKCYLCFISSFEN